MPLFRRVGDIIAANLNELVDRFDDPEVMLKQAIREMDTMIEQATAAAARAIAHERLLARDLAEHERTADLWRVRTEQAVRQGDDSLARQAITRAYEHDALARALHPERSSAGQAADALRRQVTAMKAKHAEAGRKLGTLAARRQTAETSVSLRGMGTASAHPASGFSRFEQLRPRVERAEAEALALAELLGAGPPGSEAEAEIEAASREQAQRVEAELAAIKERLRSLSS